jgi:hypothetical protein
MDASNRSGQTETPHTSQYTRTSTDRLITENDRVTNPALLKGYPCVIPEQRSRDHTIMSDITCLDGADDARSC